jgi:hypothetical protein
MFALHATGGLAARQEIPVGQGGTASSGRLRRTAELVKAMAVGTSRQSLAMFGPTKESSLITEAHGLRHAR